MIKRMRFVSIAVPNIDEAAAFWREALGFAPRGEWEPDGAGVRIARLGAGDAEIALLQPTNADGAVARFIDQRGPGLYHVSLEVEDIELALRTMLARGGELLDREPRDGPEGRVAFVRPRSMRGVLVELWEPSTRQSGDQEAQ